jgi:hypothetical protein
VQRCLLAFLTCFTLPPRVREADSVTTLHACRDCPDCCLCSLALQGSGTVGRVGDKQWHGNALRVAEGRGFPRCATALLLRSRFRGGCASFLPHKKRNMSGNYSSRSSAAFSYYPTINARPLQAQQPADSIARSTAKLTTANRNSPR